MAKNNKMTQQARAGAASVKEAQGLTAPAVSENKAALAAVAAAGEHSENREHDADDMIHQDEPGADSEKEAEEEKAPITAEDGQETLDALAQADVVPSILQDTSDPVIDGEPRGKIQSALPGADPYAAERAKIPTALTPSRPKSGPLAAEQDEE